MVLVDWTEVGGLLEGGSIVELSSDLDSVAEVSWTEVAIAVDLTGVVDRIGVVIIVECIGVVTMVDWISVVMMEDSNVLVKVPVDWDISERQAEK